MPTGYCGEIPPLHDAGLFCGHYPFRKLPLSSPFELAEWMESQNIASAVATPFEGIFYRDPFAALSPWLDAKVPGLKFWLTLNPASRPLTSPNPTALSEIIAAAEEDAIAGVRLFPRYHGYSLDHPGLDYLLTLAANFSLPVNLTARILDDRLHPYPFRADDPLLPADVAGLILRHPDVNLVLSFFTMHELAEMREAIAASPCVNIDIGCAKPFEFWGDDLRALAPVDRFIYGSGAPLHYHLGNRISLHRAGFSEAEEEAILNGNLRRLLEAKPNGGQP